MSLFFFFFGCFLSIFLRAYYIINRLCFLFVFFSLICHDIPTDIKDMCVILTYCFKIRYGLSLYMSAMHLMHVLTSQPFCLNAHYTEDLEQLQHKLLCSWIDIANNYKYQKGYVIILNSLLISIIDMLISECLKFLVMIFKKILWFEKARRARPLCFWSSSFWKNTHQQF